MRMTSVVVHRQSGSISAVLLGLTGLAGFLAGAVVAVLALDGDVATSPAAVRAATGPDLARQEVPADPVSSRDWIAPGAASGWPYESAAPSAAGAPGRSRRDLLSAPEGWTPGP
jgi:hypothetical protein